MKIAISAASPGLDAEVDPRFGRSPVFTIVETDDRSEQTLINEHQSLGQGAGIQTARTLAERGVECVLTGNCGPNAQQTLSAAGIRVITGCAGAVRDAIEQFIAGNLPEPQPADAPSDHVAGGGASAFSSPDTVNAGFGRGRRDQGAGGVGRGRGRRAKHGPGWGKGRRRGADA